METPLEKRNRKKNSLRNISKEVFQFDENHKSTGPRNAITLSKKKHLKNASRNIIQLQRASDFKKNYKAAKRKRIYSIERNKDEREKLRKP
jgi:hypothetical protein